MERIENVQHKSLAGKSQRGIWFDIDAKWVFNGLSNFMTAHIYRYVCYVLQHVIIDIAAAGKKHVENLIGSLI